MNIALIFRDVFQSLLKSGRRNIFSQDMKMQLQRVPVWQFLKENSNLNNNGGFFLFKNSSYWLKIWYRHENTEFSHFGSTMIQVGALHCTDQKNLNKSMAMVPVSHLLARFKAIREIGQKQWNS